jgi:hypothetical protein
LATVPLGAGNTATETGITHSAESLRRNARKSVKNAHRTREINLKADQIPVTVQVLSSRTDRSGMSNVASQRDI